MRSTISFARIYFYAICLYIRICVYLTVSARDSHTVSRFCRARWVAVQSIFSCELFSRDEQGRERESKIIIICILIILDLYFFFSGALFEFTWTNRYRCQHCHRKHSKHKHSYPYHNLSNAGEKKLPHALREKKWIKMWLCHQSLARYISDSLFRSCSSCRTPSFFAFSAKHKMEAKKVKIKFLNIIRNNGHATAVAAAPAPTATRTK